MAAKVEFPIFTCAQWQELERQAMIYKCMMESIPLPSHLLLPSTITNFAADTTITDGTGSNIYKLMRCRNNNYKNSDEAGRCKRTDGKKWRCSREVAPNHKYCERHMHRGRPRSRKPVELHATDPLNNNKKGRRLNNSSSPLQTAAAAAPQPDKSSPDQQQMLQKTPIQEPNGTIPLFLDTDLSMNAYTNRDVGWNWMMKDKMQESDGVEQQWPHLISNKMALASEGCIYDSNAPLFQHDYCGQEALNLFSYTELAATGDFHRNYECQFFFNSDLVSLDKQPQMETPRGFIDAWSNDNLKTTNEPPVSSPQLSPCSLTLSMAMAADHNTVDEELGKIQDIHCVEDMVEIKRKDSTTWEGHSCWVPFARGGPLAEVLHTGSLATGSKILSPPRTNNGDLITAPASTVSSPRRALFSQSDTGICNSPILPCIRSTN